MNLASEEHIHTTHANLGPDLIPPSKINSPNESRKIIIKDLEELIKTLK